MITVDGHSAAHAPHPAHTIGLPVPRAARSEAGALDDDAVPPSAGKITVLGHLDGIVGNGIGDYKATIHILVAESLLGHFPGDILVTLMVRALQFDKCILEHADLDLAAKLVPTRRVPVLVVLAFLLVARLVIVATLYTFDGPIRSNIGCWRSQNAGGVG